MRISNHLVERLARLEARVASLPDPEAEREWERLHELHYRTWLNGGCFEDIPEEDRDPHLWELQTTFLPVVLQMFREEPMSVPKELLEAGIDFTQLEGSDEDDVRAFLKNL